VAVHDRAVDVVPSDGAGGPHGSVVAAGRLAARLELAVRSLGWEPERVMSGPLVTVVAKRRRPVVPLVLARVRVDRRLREGLRPGHGRPELSQVVDVTRGASTTRAWCVLANGPSHDGAPGWRYPGTPIPEAAGIDLPWVRDPVLAVCTHDDGLRDHVSAGVASQQAVVTAGLRGLRADVHAAALEDPADRRAWGHRLDPRSGCVQALVHLYP
jgi:hypothetical protein